MIVIGDAAHAPTPSSGQGASLAIEDAVILARCLRESPDAPGAFAAFEQHRRHRVERIVAQGARTSSSKAAGPVGRRLRDLMLPILFRYVITEKSMAWMSQTITSSGILPSWRAEHRVTQHAEVRRDLKRSSAVQEFIGSPVETSRPHVRSPVRCGGARPPATPPARDRVSHRPWPMRACRRRPDPARRALTLSRNIARSACEHRRLVAGCSTGNMSSTRRSRLRVIQSALAR